MTLTAVGPNPTRIVTAGDGPGVLANRDINNQVLIGKDISITGQNTNSYSILDPLVGLPVSGEKDIYACCLPGVTSVFVDWLEGMDIQDWQPSPGEAALQVSALGIPPIDNPTAVEIIFNQTIAAGATFTSPRMTFKQFQSYFGTLFSTSTGAQGAAPFTQVEWQHSVASDNFDPLRLEDWFIPNTPFNFTYNYRHDLAGFIIGDTITLVITNLDGQPTNVTFGLFGSYRSRTRTQMRGRYFAQSPTPQFGLGSDDVLASMSVVALAAGNAQLQLMNLCEGPAILSGVLSNGGASTFVSVEALPSSFNSVQEVAVPASGIIPPTQIILPRHVCELILQNNTAGPISGNVTVTAQVQPE